MLLNNIVTVTLDRKTGKKISRTEASAERPIEATPAVEILARRVFDRIQSNRNYPGGTQ